MHEANDFGTRMHDNLTWAGALGRLAAEAAFAHLLMRTAEEAFQKAHDTDMDNTDTGSVSLLGRQMYLVIERWRMVISGTLA